MVSQTGFARLRGVNRREVTRWKHDGLLVFDASGGVDVAASNAILDDRAKNPGGAIEPASVSGMPSLSESRRKKEAALAAMRELELARRQGELVPVAELEPAWASIILGIRSAFMRLPSRAAVELGLTREQARGLAAMIREALTAAANEPPARRGSQALNARRSSARD